MSVVHSPLHNVVVHNPGRVENGFHREWLPGTWFPVAVYDHAMYRQVSVHNYAEMHKVVCQVTRALDSFNFDRIGEFYTPQHSVESWCWLPSGLWCLKCSTYILGYPRCLYPTLHCLHLHSKMSEAPTLEKNTSLSYCWLMIEWQNAFSEWIPSTKHYLSSHTPFSSSTSHTLTQWQRITRTCTHPLNSSCTSTPDWPS